jgi:dienelactone hydrolase
MLCAKRLLSSVLLLVLALAASAAAARDTGPWDTKHLATAPKAEWGEKSGGVQQVLFTGEPVAGKPTRVFAYYARPEKGEGPFPAMVLLHGGGGKAFPEWAKLWADRGYVALAIDLAGHGPDGKRLSDGGPEQDDQTKFAPFDDAHVRDTWTYHAVADALLGHSLLAAQKDVDPKRIGVTGISWGGYLTCIVAGVDERFNVAVPVYGCGFLDQNSYWIEGSFNKMPAEQRARWVKHLDPSSYLKNVTCPILFVNGTNDFAYPLDSYKKSYELVDPKLRNLCVTVNMPHGHSQGWAPKEIGLFVDSVLTKGKPLVKLSAPKLDGDKFSCQIEGHAGVVEGQLHFTNDGGPWQKRAWKSVEAKLNSTMMITSAPQIDRKQGVFFFTVRDERGAIVSSPHVDFASP